MKQLYCFLVFLFFSLISQPLSAQYKLLEESITVHITDQSLEEVLDAISEAGEFFFSYNSNLLELDRQTTVHLNEISIKEALDQVIADSSISYKEIGNHIILNRIHQTSPAIPVVVAPSPRPASPVAAPKPVYLRGTIVDKETGRQLLHASVYDLITGEAAVSDENGTFRLKLPPSTTEARLSIKHRLYLAQTIELDVTKDRRIEVSLQPRTLQQVQPKSFFLASSDTINPLKDVAFVSLFVDDSTLNQPASTSRLQTVLGQFSFLPRFGTQRLNWQKFNRLSFNLLAGYSAGLKGIELGLLMNADRYGVAGLQVAGIGNAVGGNLAGVQIAGVFNVNKESVYGAQIAGVNNWADSLTGVQISPVNNVLKGRMYGAQITGGVNVASGEVYGAQLSGCINASGGKVQGWQVAGLANWGKELEGVQASGLANFSTGNKEGKVQGAQVAGLFNIGQTLYGTQVSGLFNISTGDFQGAQISSLFNVAKKGRGIQIGLVNISDSLKGIPIGLLNIIRDGHNGIEYGASPTFPISLRLKTGNHRLYNIFAAGMRPNNGNMVWGYAYGLGTAIRIFKKSHIHGELLAWQVHQDERFITDLNLLTQFQMAYAVPIKNRFQVSLGPTLNFHLSQYKNPDTGEFLTELAPNTTLEGSSADFQGQFWMGGHVSIMLLK